jgi:glycerol-3-phosphate acyltransferase PlsX
MKSSEHLNFGGNIDANMVFFDAVNVVVCSAVHGNILIKGAEGGVNLFKHKLGFIWKIIAFLWGHRQRSDAKEIGGCLIVGVQGDVVKPHGNSPPIAIANGIRQAKHSFQMGIVKAIADYYTKMAKAKESGKNA